MIENFETKFNSNNIPVYVDTFMKENEILVGKNGTKKYIIVSPKIYEELKWNEFDINDKRYKILKEIFG
jgi:hypothetical protein